MDRDNTTWSEHLRSSGPEQQAALADLRAALLRGLSSALATYRQVDESFLEDVAQEALVRILERLPQFEGRSRFVTWATSIAVRVALTELRRRRWKDVSLDALLEGRADLEPPAGAGQAEPPAVVLTERRQVVDTLYAVIGRELTTRQRTALIAELKGMPQAEIARQLNSNRNAIYKLTHDARKRLRRGLEAAGVRAEDVRAAFAT